MLTGSPKIAVITRADASHAGEARLLLAEYYREVGVVQTDTPQDIDRYLQGDERGGLWLACVGQVPAGCVVLRPLGGLHASAECKRLYVRPAFRRQGIGEALLDTMEAFARSASLHWIYLDSKDDLQAALALYGGRGYEPCARYNDNPQATVFLRKALVP